MNQVLALPLRIQQAIALLLLGCLAFALYIFFIQPLQATYETGAKRLETAHARLDRASSLAADLPYIRQNIQTLSQDQRLTQGLLPAGTIPEATAAVQSRIRQCIEQAGGSIRTISNLQPDTQADLIEIGVSVTARMSLDGFDSMLARLETGQPYIFIRSIDIQRPASQRRNTSAASEAQSELVFRFDVIGLSQTERPA